MTSREKLGRLVGRPIPEEGPLCLTRPERRDLTNVLVAHGHQDGHPSYGIRVSKWNGEPIYVYGDESGHCDE